MSARDAIPPAGDGGAAIAVEVTGARGVVRLTRPRARNALDGAAWRAIAEAISRLEREPTVRAIVLRADGAVFSAGADLDWLRSATGDDLTSIADALTAVSSCPRPVVARVHGAAFGGAVGLIASCDVVIASASATFSLAEVRVGVAPAIVSSVLTGRVGTARFRTWALLGAAVDAEAARRAGLVDQVAPDTDLDSAVDDILDRLAKGEPEALSSIKRIPVGGFSTADAVAELIRLRDRPSFAAGVDALRSREAPPWYHR